MRTWWMFLIVILGSAKCADPQRVRPARLNAYLLSEMAFQDAAERSVDIRVVPWRLHQGSAASVCGFTLFAHHPAYGHPQLCEFHFGCAVALSHLFLRLYIDQFFNLFSCLSSSSLETTAKQLPTGRSWRV